MAADADIEYRNRVRGSLLAGALGDALGAGIEFLRIGQIRREFGKYGVTGLTPAYGQPAAITDDTQMTLFTVEGLIRAAVRNASGGTSDQALMVWHAYQRWLTTQSERCFAPAALDDPGWLVGQPVLQHRRAPGNSCLSGLRNSRMGTLAAPANPDSKGCGSVMRSAPFGWLPAGDEDVWQAAIAGAVLTHGHPTGYFAAGATALLVHRLVLGDPLDLASRAAHRRLAAEGEPARETDRALTRAVAAARRGGLKPERIEELGEGWVADEAFAISVYCALAAPDTESALLAAVNHSGDSDSTGAITGNLVGALYGEAALPPDWVGQLEGLELLSQVADDFVTAYAPSGNELPNTLVKRYPGC